MFSKSWYVLQSTVSNSFLNMRFLLSQKTPFLYLPYGFLFSSLSDSYLWVFYIPDGWSPEQQKSSLFQFVPPKALST